MPATVDELKAQKERLDAEKLVLDSQIAKRESEKKLAGLNAEPNATVIDLQNQKAIADAQKALVESQTQSTLARMFGDVKSGTYTGSVELKANAGAQETLLLAARAVQEAADQIADALKQVPGLCDKILVFAARDFPNFQRLAQFRFRIRAIAQTFEAVEQQPDDSGLESIMVQGGNEEAIAPAAAATAGLDALSKMLGFLKTDFSMGGMEAKVDESLLLYAVAGRLACRCQDVSLPTVSTYASQANAISRLSAELQTLATLRAAAERRRGTLDSEVSRLQQELAALPADPDGTNPSRTELQESIAVRKQEIDRLAAAIAQFDAFATSLTTPDSAGVVPVGGLLQEIALETALQGGAAALLLRLENTGGGYLLKKHLFAGLFGIPLYHTGGATVSYLLLDGASGRVLAGDAVPVQGGFIRADQLRETLRS